MNKGQQPAHQHGQHNISPHWSSSVLLHKVLPAPVTRTLMIKIKIYKEQKLVQTFTWQCNHYGHFWIRFKKVFQTSPEASELQHTLDVQS